MPKKAKGKRNIKQPKISEIIEADSRFDQEYAQVSQKTGDCSFKVVTVKKKEVTGNLCGKMRFRKVTVDIGNWVLIEPFDEKNKLYQIKFRYTPSHVTYLSDAGFLKSNEDPNIVVERENDLEPESRPAIDDGITFGEVYDENAQYTDSGMHDNYDAFLDNLLDGL
jgi:translation initiation factor IF-1